MTGTGTNTYLLDDSSGKLAVIDPGPDDPQHIEAILRAAWGRITTVLVTHRHLDHLPAARPLCERTGAVLAGHAGLPGVDKPLGDADPAFGGLLAIATPGHTDDSLCFWSPTEGALFTGDLVAGAGTVVIDERPGALADYLRSVERLLDLQPRTLYPGHGPILRDGDATAKLAEYLAHRRQREQQILSVLAQHGPASVATLVSAIYPDLLPELVPMAARNVRAHLDKLAAEQRVASQSDGVWCLSR
jgi:glyoxylase-like metal-dependent hydrolase (beta-lactamase superfamily II)